MKILLTGEPRAGKTTLLQELARQTPHAYTIFSDQILNKEGQRIGFRAETSSGASGVFAHKHDIASGELIGNYVVDTAQIQRLFNDSIREAVAEKYKWIVLDEIGRMQKSWPEFLVVVDELLQSDVNVLATIRYGDDWAQRFTQLDHVITVTLTPDSREAVRGALKAAIVAAPLVNDLPNPQQRQVVRLANGYFASAAYLQLGKLFNHAVKYVAEHRITELSAGDYEVTGDHDRYHVSFKDGIAQCECDLFNGRGAYKDRAGECSHIQAALVISH